MAYTPITLTVTQYENSSTGLPYSGAVLKAYSAGTSNVLPMATDTTGGTTFTSIQLNSGGFPELSGNVVIPHVNAAFKLSLYPTQTAANANTGAIWTIDNLDYPISASAFGRTLAGSADAAAAMATLGAAGLGTKNVFTKTQTWTKGTNIASTAALPVDSGDGNYFDVTGNNTITSLKTVGIGTVIKLHFNGILTITYHATDLVLPGAASITTAAGDEAEFIEYAVGDWRCTNYTQNTNLVSQGTWTPVLKGTGVAGVHTYNQQEGTYYTVGKLVYATFGINITALDAAMTGDPVIGGLEGIFSQTSPSEDCVSFGRLGGIDIGGDIPSGVYESNQVYIYLLDPVLKTYVLMAEADLAAPVKITGSFKFVRT